MRKVLIPLCLTALLLTACKSTNPFSGMHNVLIKTSLGNILVQLDGDAAPKTVENFLTHVQNGYYNNLTFHRVIPEFMIQGGDPEGNGTGGTSIWDEDFADEISAKSYGLDKTKLKDVTDEELPAEMQNMTVEDYYKAQGYVYNNKLDSLPMDRGALAMANRGANTNGSQFFIIQREGGTPWLNGKHTVFGKVVEGMDIVDRIASVKRDENDLPTTPVTYTMEVIK